MPRNLVLLAPYFLSISLLLISCKKKGEYGDNCTIDCITLSGNVKTVATNTNLNNVEVKLMGTKGIFLKTIVTSHSDTSGNWIMSFSKSGLNQLSNFKLDYRLKNYLQQEKEIDLDSNDVNTNIFTQAYLKPTAIVNFSFAIEKNSVASIKTEYFYGGKEHSNVEQVSNEKPTEEKMTVIIPSNTDIQINVSYRTEVLGANTGWKVLNGSPFSVNLADGNSSSYNLVID